jgi:hypothetical protein
MSSDKKYFRLSPLFSRMNVDLVLLLYTYNTPTYNQSASFTQKYRGDQAEEWRWGRVTYNLRGTFQILFPRQ